MSEYKLTVSLEQYTPLLQFQYDQPGATLRATEVKPKLDRFIASYLKSRGAEPPASWKSHESKNHTSYRYSMRFSAKSSQPMSDLRIMEKLLLDKDMLNEALWAESVTMTIMCPLTDRVVIDGSSFSLTALLKKLLPPFFALHCFGLRSGKGFGSFGVTAFVGDDEPVREPEPSELVAFLPSPDPEYYAPYTPALYFARYGKGGAAGNVINTLTARMNDVVTLSALMKGGLNFGTCYVRGYIREYDKLEGRSEKAFIKRDILPDPAEDEQVMQKHDIHPAQKGDAVVYKRAMLGLAPIYEYKANPKNGITRSGKVTVTAEDKEIERFANPVCFKPSGSYLLMIPQPIPKKMLHQEFEFSGKRSGRAGHIYTPAEFDLSDFLDSFAAWYNNPGNSELASARRFHDGGFDFAATFNHVKKIESTKNGGDTNA